METRSVTRAAERIGLTQPRLRVERDPQGRWMVERWARTAPSGGSAKPDAAASSQTWSVALGRLDLDGGVAVLRDASLQERLPLAVTDMRVRLRDVGIPAGGSRTGSLSMSARLGAGRADPGRLEYEGAVALAPLKVQGRLAAKHVPLHALAPYLQGALRARIGRADGSFVGQVRLEQTEPGLQWAVQGDAALDDVRVRPPSVVEVEGEEGPETLALSSTQEGDDVLQWRSLGLRGIDAAQPAGGALSLSVRESALSDFFARVSCSPTVD